MVLRGVGHSGPLCPRAFALVTGVLCAQGPPGFAGALHPGPNLAGRFPPSRWVGGTSATRRGSLRAVFDRSSPLSYTWSASCPIGLAPLLAGLRALAPLPCVRRAPPYFGSVAYCVIPWVLPVGGGLTYRQVLLGPYLLGLLKPAAADTPKTSIRCRFGSSLTDPSVLAPARPPWAHLVSAASFLHRWV